jgi:hypothetical protein
LKRWQCPLCGSGKLAPSRPRKIDVRRYCLACSEKTGELVERRCPTLDRRREAVAAKKKQRRRATDAKKKADPRWRIHTIWRRWRNWAPKIWGVDAGRFETIRVVMSRSPGSSGSAWTARGHISLKIDPSTAVHTPDGGESVIRSNFADHLALLLHEMTHLACDHGERHGDQFRSMLADAARYLLGEHFITDGYDLSSVYGGLDPAVAAGFQRAIDAGYWE